MNFLQEIVAFNEYKVLNSLSAGQISLWYALIGINNKWGWNEWFSVSNKVLEAHSGLSQTGIYNARKVLRERGLIDYEYNGEQATRYKIIPITLFGNSARDTTRDTTRGTTRGTTRDTTRGTTRDTTTLYKQDKTKQNKNYYNNKSSFKKSPLNNYEDCNTEDYYKLEEDILARMEAEAD